MIKDKNKTMTCGVINELASSPKDFLLSCTSDYAAAVENAADIICSDENKKIIMLAGPSSSGKTTTAHLLASAVEGRGAKCYPISLDDFYHSHSSNRYPLDETGKPDYECVESLDLDLLHRCLNELLSCGKSCLPLFDFKSGERSSEVREIELNNNDIIIIEGLHALNPVITETLDAQALFKIYVSVSSRIYEEDGSVLFSKRDLRFIRRMVRDYRTRNSSPDSTFAIWNSVMRGEDKYLFPFEPLADLKLDSFHACEPCVLADEGMQLLKNVGGEYAAKAALLYEKLALFDKIDYSILPADSLLREFTG